MPEADTRRDTRRTAAAARMRRTRRRRALGAVHICLDVFAEGIATLIRLGWLSARDAGDRAAVKAALADFVEAAV